MEKNIFIFCLLFLGLASGFSQNKKYSNFYHQRTSLFEQLPISKKDIVFIGNSITNGAEWCELFNNKNVKNRGINGDSAEGVLDRLFAITQGKPKKIFLMIGINNLVRGKTPNEVALVVESIVEKIQEESPKTKIYIQSVLPTSRKLPETVAKQGGVEELNNLFQEITNKYKLTYIDLYPHFLNENKDGINPQYANDGLHLMGEGYLLWKQIILPYLK